jgi:thiamine biosynthesis lipoprotein
VEQIMGLPVSVHVRGPRAVQEGTPECVRRLFAVLRDADRRFSTYRPESEVSAFRAGTLGVPSPQLAEVLRLCDEAGRRTGGAFDPHLPGGFDPSGLVKGWAVERAAEELRELDGNDWLVNAGGDVVLHAEPGRNWRVGVEDPCALDRVLRVLEVAHGAVATSGAARRGEHIRDPATGGPAASDVVAATVVGPSLLWADVYATAGVVAGTGVLARLAAEGSYRALLVLRSGALVSTLPHA